MKKVQIPILFVALVGSKGCLQRNRCWQVPTVFPRSEGFTYSEGKSVIIKEDGEKIGHRSQGIGGFDFQTGKIKNHGSTFFSTNSTGGNLGFLNNMVGIWADEIDPVTGIAHAKTWLLE